METAKKLIKADETFAQAIGTINTLSKRLQIDFVPAHSTKQKVVDKRGLIPEGLLEKVKRSLASMID